MLGIKKVNHRRLGNQHREARDWAAAAVAYEKHLERKPDDVAIWVQLGHMLKEAGRLDHAERAYRQAVDRSSGDVDALLQYGRFLKLKGDPAGALVALQAVANIKTDESLDEEMKSVMIEVRKLDSHQLVESAVLYSLQDLFVFFDHHVTMSGIQRVQAGIALSLIEKNDPNNFFIITDAHDKIESGQYWVMDNGDVRRVIEYASGEIVDHGRLQALVRRCRENAYATEVSRGQTVVLLGSFWSLGNTVDRFIAAKERGARLGAYVYDIIPLSHPQFCDAGLTREFGTALCELCMVADFFFTISAYTKVVLDKFIAENDIRPIPVTAIPLAHTLTGSASTETWSSRIRHLKGKRYVTYVSTLEGRKNHAFVISVWQQLIAEGVDVPDLVFVGRLGWRIENLKDTLEATNNLGGRVHILNDMSDGELNALYRGSQFTIFTSFVEGWGLPVGESLLHGIPCVASNSSSIPEVGGDFVDYVDPFNITGGVDVIRRLVVDASYLRSRREDIRQNFSPRTWDDVAFEFAAAVAEVQRLEPVDSPAPLLNEAEVYLVGDLADPRLPIRSRMKTSLRMALASSFGRAEPHGAWMKGRSGSVEIATPFEAGTSVIVYLRIIAAPWAGNCTLSVGNAGQVETLRTFGVLQISGRVLTLEAKASESGRLFIDLNVSGAYEIPPYESRDIVIALERIGYTNSKSIGNRITLIEGMSFESAQAL